MLHNEHYDLAIIGGGPGGLSASIYAARANLRTILLEYGLPGGQLNLTDEVENYLGFGSIRGSELATKFFNHASLYDLNLVKSEVLQLRRKESIYEITLAGGKLIKSKTVILATGGSPRKLQIPGEDELYGNGVSYCATCDGFFFRNKTVIVVGGGDSAAEESIFLAKLCSKIYLVHRRRSLRASKLLQERVVKNDKIVILWNTRIMSIIANSNGVAGVILVSTETRKTKKMETDGIFIFVGYKPNNQLFPEEIEVDANGMAITSDTCETNMPGLYVIGDIRSKPARQIILSVADGCNAVIAAAKYLEKI